MTQRTAILDEEDLQATVQALSTLALCHQGQIVALGAAVEATLAVMSKSSPGVARQLASHLAASASDHRNPQWQNDQRLAFDTQLSRLHTLLRLLGASSQSSAALAPATPPAEASAPGFCPQAGGSQSLYGNGPETQGTQPT